MNFNNLINRLKMYHYPYWGQLALIFYEEKLKEIQYTPKTELALAIYKKVCSIIIKKRDCQNIQINEDLKYKIIPYRLYFFLEYTEGSIGIPISLWGKSDTLLEIIDSIPNEEYQKIIDSFPKWEEEYKTVCRENVRQIESVMFDKFEPKSNVLKRYLDYKIYLMQALCRGEQGATANDLEAQGLQVKKRERDYVASCKNLTIEMNEKNDGMWFKIDDYSYYLTHTLPVKAILEIDRSFPQWIEEANALQHELQKQHKTKQIGGNTVVVLAKIRMRELDCEYQLNKDLLEIKLLHDRKLVVRLPYANLDRAKRILNSLSQHIAALNSVPEEYEIRSLSSSEMMDIKKTIANTGCSMKDFGSDNFCYDYHYGSEKAIAINLPQKHKLETLKLTAQMLDKMLVHILLPKNRVLQLRKSKTPKPASQFLAEMSSYIDAINSVPYYFNIRKVLSGDKWVKEDGK